MPLTGNGTPAGSVPLDALEAEGIAGLLSAAAALAGALSGLPEAEAACAGAAPDYDGIEDLRIALAVAAGDLDDAIEAHAGILRP